MKEFALMQLTLFARIIIASACGAFIGYERKNRGKGAGIRTHIIVALASSLMMITSKYGFFDLSADMAGIRGADPARIAAQIVSGIGFLGAGMIFVQKKTVQGLTTAAGIWATAGIGMAIGSGMYTIGILATVTIIVIQIILHRNLKFLHMPTEEQLQLVIINEHMYIERIENYLTQRGVQIISTSFKKTEDGKLSIKITASFPDDFRVTELLDIEGDFVESAMI